MIGYVRNHLNAIKRSLMAFVLRSHNGVHCCGTVGDSHSHSQLSTANVIDIKRPEIREAAIRVRDTALAQDTLDESDRQCLYEAYRILMWHYYYRWDEEGRGINDRRAAIANATALLDLGINDSSNDRAEAILHSFKVKR